MNQLKEKKIKICNTEGCGFWAESKGRKGFKSKCWLCRALLKQKRNEPIKGRTSKIIS